MSDGSRHVHLPVVGGGEAVVPVDEVGRQIASQAVEQADGLTGPVEVLHYASALTFFWEGGRRRLGREDSDAFGLEVVKRLAQSPGRRARMLLRGIATLAEEPVRGLAAARASELEVVGRKPLPPWLRTIGEIEVKRAGRVGDPATDDGTTVLFDLAWPCGAEAGLGVFIDPGLGGIAKHILVGPLIDECADDLSDPESGRGFEELTAAEAEAVARAGLSATEAVRDLEAVGDTYRSQRAFLRFHLDRIAAGVSAEPRSVTI